MMNHTTAFTAASLVISVGGFAQAGQVFTDEGSFLAALGQNANPVLIDFDQTPTGPFAGNEFVGDGVTFSSTADTLNVEDALLGPVSPYLSVGRRPFSGGSSNNDDLTVTLSGAAGFTAAGFRIVDSLIPNRAGETVQFFGASNNLLLSYGAGATDYLAFIADEPIHRIEIDEAGTMATTSATTTSSSRACRYSSSATSTATAR